MKKQINFFLTIITHIFHPMLMPVISVFFILRLPFFDYSPPYYHFNLIASTLFLTFIVPAFSVFLLQKKGKIDDWFISRKEQRTIPYVVAIVTYVLWIVLLYQYFNFPIEFTVIAAGTVLSILGLMVINVKWKISAHSAGVGGLLAGVLSVSYITLINPVLLIMVIIVISGLVIISRIVLKAHTPWQVIIGFIWGGMCFIIPLFFLELFSHWLQHQPIFD